MFHMDSSVRFFARTALVVCLLLGVVGTSAPRAFAGDDPNHLPPSKRLLRGQYLKGYVWHGGVFDPARISPFSAPAGAHLTYYGGRVVSSMQVVQVLWGSGSYLSNVTSTGTPSMASFYQQLLSSTYTDWLDSEYNTVAPSGTKTNQHIAQGGFAGQYTITPSTNAPTVDDSVIQSELAAQIAAGHLPAPTTDAAGNNNTYYAIFFPHGKTITLGSASSCQSGGFCAYHGTIANVGGHEIYYGIHPDMQSGSGCDTGCGASTPFGNYTSVASHEMVETITDAEVGLATTNAPPLAWYDNTNGEIGDICNAQQGTFVGNDGQTYVLQLEFSNAQSNCIVPSVSYPPPTSDFSISASPASVSIVRGSSGTSTISTAAIGASGTVSLAVSGAPAGVTATLSPTSVTAGGSSTLTISTAASTLTGTYTLTIAGTEGANAHSTTVSLTVTSAPANDFSISANPTGVTIAAGSSGSSTISTATTSGSAQTVSLSASGAPSGVTATLTPTSVTSGQSSTLNISTTTSAAAGTSTLTVTGTAASGSHSAAVTLTVTSGGGGTGITNGDFETGNLSGWTAAGASETVVNSGCHGGTYCAELGKTSPTNGDSTITQTFTAPAGMTGISFWYRETCPDTITYDWAIVTLKDNTAGTTATLLTKNCSSTAWSNRTGSVTAGHSYTLSMTNHDDNYPGDPTFTLYDDVALTNTAPPPAGGITNGGFESGATGWTASGTTSIVSTGCHGGVSCARAGSTVPTNGNSTFSQTFTVPSGKTQLSAWYKMSCPDTVAYDWVTITLKNNTGGSTTTVVPKTCTTNPWTNVTTPVTAGSSYTLSLTSHDDNYSADPSFTLFDDVVLN